MRGIKCVLRDNVAPTVELQKERQLCERRRLSAAVERDFEAAASTLGYEWLHPSVPLRPRALLLYRLESDEGISGSQPKLN